jgi:hypothetical protein
MKLQGSGGISCFQAILYGDVEFDWRTSDY